MSVCMSGMLSGFTDDYRHPHRCAVLGALLNCSLRCAPQASLPTAAAQVVIHLQGACVTAFEF